jgi:cell volume regulation protein A
MTVDLAVLARTDVWVPGLVVGLVLSFVVRPVVAGLCLAPARLARNEQLFVMFAGLKGAVPILLGTFLVSQAVPSAERLYGIVVVVVVLSVLVQGSLVPAVARLLRLPMREVALEPFAVGVRLRDEPNGVHRFTVRAGCPAEGRRIDELHDLPEDAWVSLVVRDDRLVPVSGSLRLEAGDQLLVLADPELVDELSATFGPAG